MLRRTRKARLYRRSGYLARLCDAEEVDQVVGQWLASQVSDNLVAVDGKVLRESKTAGGKPVHLISALLHHEKMVIAQCQVETKSNEITAFKPLLEPLDLNGKVVTADAIQTQKENARFIVEDKSADYIFSVKQNQGNLFETIRHVKDIITYYLTADHKAMANEHIWPPWGTWPHRRRT